MKSKTYSPIAVIEQLLFEKIGNTKIRVWYYFVLLFLLFIVPFLLPNTVFSTPSLFMIFSVLVIVVWMAGRLIGRQISKTSSVDSILIYRFFAAASWIIPFIAGLMIIFTNRFNTSEQASFAYILGFTALVSTAHIVGIVIHIKTLKKTLRGVKKEDLFQ